MPLKRYFGREHRRGLVESRGPGGNLWSTNLRAGGSQRLSDDELAALLRSLRAVLTRANVNFSPPLKFLGHSAGIR
jgi:hypothetical protein